MLFNKVLLAAILDCFQHLRWCSHHAWIRIWLIWHRENEHEFCFICKLSTNLICGPTLSQNDSHLRMWDKSIRRDSFQNLLHKTQHYVYILPCSFPKQAPKITWPSPMVFYASKVKQSTIFSKSCSLYISYSYHVQMYLNFLASVFEFLKHAFSLFIRCFHNILHFIHRHFRCIWYETRYKQVILEIQISLWHTLFFYYSISY